VPQKVRGWHLILAVAVIAIIGVVIASRRIGSGPEDAQGMAAYLPKREAVTAYMDVAAIRNSGLLEKLVGSAIGEEDEYKTFLQRTGFDYKRDLDQVLLSSASDTHYMLLKGRFDWQKLKDYTGHEEGKCDGSYCWLPGSTPGRVISFYPVTDDLMALASGANGQAARRITSRSGEKLSFTIPAQPVWAHAPTALLLREQQRVPSGTRLFLKAIEQAEQVMLTIGPAAAGSKSGGFEVAMNVTCKSEQDAAVLKAQLESITALLSSLIRREKQSPSSADLSGVLTSGTFQRDTRQVIGRWSLSKEFVEALGKTN
jgi:hypothetical protein